MNQGGLSPLVRLWRRFGAFKQLNERDQAAVFRMINGLAAAKGQQDSESA